MLYFASDVSFLLQVQLTELFTLWLQFEALLSLQDIVIYCDFYSYLTRSKLVWLGLGHLIFFAFAVK